MKKLGFILSATCAMVIAAGGITAANLAKQPERDARIIVEVNHDLKSLNKDGVRNTQDVVYSNIKQYATNNVKITKRYNELNNAFVMEVNSSDIESIKKVPGVKSVTVDKIHWERVYNDDGYVLLNDPEDENEGEPEVEENISATTMKSQKTQMMAKVL